MPVPVVFPAVSALIYAFQQSDTFAWSIYVLLFLLSVSAWTIMIDKWISVRHALRLGNQFQRCFAESRSPVEMLLQLGKFENCPMVQVYEAGVEETAEVMDLTAEDLERAARARALPRALTADEVDRIRSTLERTVSAKVTELESRVGLLSTAVTISPFLGLLGTVWGVLMSFCGIAQAGRPDMAALAPGMSGALLTTVVGLLVAIPSVVGYNLITTAVRQAITGMDDFVENYLSALKLQGGSGKRISHVSTGRAAE